MSFSETIPAALQMTTFSESMEKLSPVVPFGFTNTTSGDSGNVNFTSNETFNYFDNSSGYYDYEFDYYDYIAGHEFPVEKYRVVPLWEAVFKVAIYSNIIVLSLVGNILIVVVVVCNKRLRTTTNYYIVNLAISDLLVTLSCSWVHLVGDLTTGWVLGTFFCKLNSFAQGMY